MKRLFSALVLMGGIVGAAPLVHAAAPIPEFSGGVVPSLAPMLHNITPGVVNIAVKGRVREQNPLLQDPFFPAFLIFLRGRAPRSAKPWRPAPASSSTRPKAIF